MTSLIGASHAGGRRRRRNDWRQGGRAVEKWNSRVLPVALVGMGAGVFGAGLSSLLLPGTPLASTLALWAALVAATAYAFARARPAGLLRIRFTDLLWGLSLGLALRALQGLASGADATAFPSASSTPGVPAPTWWLTEFLPAGFIGPMVEEFFFRAVVLVVVYQVFRRSVGMTAAAVTALLVSAGLFVLLHGMRGSLPLTDGIMLFAVGAVCGLLVLLTGRLWGAVILHVVYNVSFLALAIAGATLG